MQWKTWRKQPSYASKRTCADAPSSRCGIWQINLAIEPIFFFPCLEHNLRFPKGSPFPDAKAALGLLGSDGLPCCHVEASSYLNKTGLWVNSWPHIRTPPKTHHDKQLSRAALLLWSRSRDESCLLFLLLPLAPFSFLTTSSNISGSLSCWAGVLNEVTTRAALGCVLKCCLKRAFLSFPLIFYPLHHPISFTLAFPCPLSFSSPITSFNVFPLAPKSETEGAQCLCH